MPWGWKIDNIAPDAYDIIGGIVTLLDVGIIMYLTACSWR
ncbi:hypothetical protein [Desulfosarcina sp.]